MIKKLRKYCPACPLHETFRYRPHGNLQPIDHAARPLEVVSRDLVTELLWILDVFSAVLTRICYKLKTVGFALGRKDRSGAKRAAASDNGHVFSGAST